MKINSVGELGITGNYSGMIQGEADGQEERKIQSKVNDAEKQLKHLTDFMVKMDVDCAPIDLIPGKGKVGHFKSGDDGKYSTIFEYDPQSRKPIKLSSDYVANNTNPDNPDNLQESHMTADFDKSGKMSNLKIEDRFQKHQENLTIERSDNLTTYSEGYNLFENK